MKLTKKELETLYKKVYEYKTKSKHGFTDAELKTLMDEYPTINDNKFNSALMCITCMVIDKETITYHIDVYHALLAGLERRDLTVDEWD